MPKVANIVKFKKPGKKDLEREAKRTSAKPKAEELLDVVRDLVNDIPGLSSKEIDKKLQRVNQNTAALLLKYVSRGHLRRKHLDGYWRYYAKNYRFSDDPMPTKKKQPVSTTVITTPAIPTPTSPSRGRSLADYRAEALSALGRGQTIVAPASLMRIRAVLLETPGLSARELEIKAGNITSQLLGFIKSGQLKRFDDPKTGVFRYLLPEQPIPVETPEPKPTKEKEVVTPEPEPITVPNQVPAAKLEKEDVAVDEKPAEVEVLAKQFYWETQENDLHKFIDWYKKQLHR